VSATLSLRALQALALGAGAHGARQLLQVAAFLVLARFIAPAEFGLIGMVVAVLGFVTILGEAGVGAALVQAPAVPERTVHSIFWITTLLGAAVAVMVAASASAVAAMYAEPAVIAVVRAAAATVLLTSVAVVPAALLQRELRVGAIGAVELVATAAGCGVAIALAVAGFGIWSLVAQLVMTSAVSAAGMCAALRWHPRFVLDLRATRALLRFAVRVASFNICNYLVRNTDDVLVGRFFGAGSLGLYGRAYALLMLPVNAVAAVFGRVMLPLLARLAHEDDSFRRAYLTGIQGVAFCAFPALMGLFVVADDFVTTSLGPDWSGLTPFIRVFALLGITQSVAGTTSWVFQSRGRSDLMLRWSIATAPILIGSFVVGVALGSAYAVAICYAITSGVLLFYPAIAYMGRVVDLPVGRVVATLLPTLLCAIAMAAVVAGLRTALLSDWSPAARLIASVICGVITYLGASHAAGLEVLERGRATLASAGGLASVPPDRQRSGVHEVV
jgi:O-antigen/teichoic acid export membrane protein